MLPALAVGLFALLAYWPSLHAQFIGDDYVFFDRVRDIAFGDLWSRAHTDFGWWRPWSREFHFWLLNSAFGPSEAAFHVTSLLLWFAMLVLYRTVLARDTGDRAADLAMLAVAGLSLWGASLTWVSGVQDLWMLVFALLALRVDQSRHWGWTVLPYAFALLSKETAVTVPILVGSRALLLSRLDVRQAFRRVAPLAVVTLVWLVWHPALIHRLTHPEMQLATGDPPLPPLEVVVRSLSALFSLELVGHRLDADAWRPVATLVSALVLAAAAALSLRGRSAELVSAPEPPTSRRLAAHGAIWCVAAWLPLFSPSVGWHAYYTSLGALGAWLALAVALERRPRIAVTVVLVLGLLRGMAAATPSWDWGSEWYQTRAGNLLGAIRRQLYEQYPRLEPHTRLYFGNLPNNIGLIAGRSPAVRVWYDDATLEAGFYSWYRPRPASQPEGRDLFFHFDSTSGIREVRLDASPPPGLEPGSPWEHDHDSLAMALLTGGDRTRAAQLFERIALIPYRVDALMFAGAIWTATGDSTRARALFEEAKRRSGRSTAEIATWASRLAQAMPPIPQPGP